MNTTIIPLSQRPAHNKREGWSDRLARSLVLRQLAKITDGQLIVNHDSKQWIFGGVSVRLQQPVVVNILSPSAWLDFAFGGSSAAGESYVQERWTCNNLTDLIRLFIRNRMALEGLDSNMRWMLYPLQRLGYWLQRNTRRGSKRNIQAHYDIGNDLFRLFLDENLMYSSAYYPDQETSLDEAAIAKLDRVCRKLELSPDHHLLEIGTGWGGLAIHAAKHYGCKVTTTTISKEQYELARRRVLEEGLSHLVDVLFQDYRDLNGKYDRIVSIEMIEAVGHQFMKQYFSQCSQLLKDDGRMLIQAITITDRYYEQALRDVDFIKRYIFPGGFLPSITEMANSLTAMTNLKISHLEDLAYHYARTLHDWRNRFSSRLDQVKSLGYSEDFIRLWNFYLCYSEGGFIERHCGLVQMILTKPDDTPSDVCY